MPDTDVAVHKPSSQPVDVISPHAPRKSARRRNSPISKSPGLRALQYFWTVVMVVFTLFPFYWMVVSALRGPDDVLTTRVLPGPFTWEGFANLLSSTPFPTYLTNSLIVSVSVTVLTIAIVTPVAYALSKMRGRAGRLASFSTLLGYMVPEVLLVIPIFIILVRLNLDDSLAGLVLGLLSLTMPLALWLMTGFMSGIPPSLEEAARMDGASWIKVFWHIVLPMSRPGILTVAIFTFISAWTDYVLPLTAIRSENLKTLPVGLSSLYGKFDASWSEIMAGAVLVSLPAMIVVALTTRYFISGLTLGATKG